MTDREKCTFVYGFSRGVALMSGMYQAGGTRENAEKACRFVLDDVCRATDPPADDETGILVEIDRILRAVGILEPAPAQERN